ncbi:MAG: anaerobic ribonucleoside-triphosphate reductase activating protein [Sulfurimonas sp. GWF2_37_8]|nr:MAG: anaerobic ribonucleoside-triphosphate reductase activating protein [Sulfurimonas sp. GWF2_37_8]
MSINKESSLSNAKIVYDITKFTHLDYPNHLACIVWFAGCNMRCKYCYNADIVLATNGHHTLFDVLVYLKTRVGLLDAVVLSGGEACAYELVTFCQDIRALGFKIKLDTNGTYFENLYLLCEAKLLDYVALDYKAPQNKFKAITHSGRFEAFSKSLDYLVQSGMDFEVRTTLHSDLLDENDINRIVDDLIFRGYDRTYYLQNFLDTKNTIGAINSPSRSIERSLLSKKLQIVIR